MADEWDNIQNKYSNIEIVNHFISNESNFRRNYFETCPTCTLELLEFFTQRKDENSEEIKEDILFWSED